MIAECDNEDLSPRTISCYKQKARALATVFDLDMPLAKLSRGGVLEYIERRKTDSIKKTTIHKELIVLRKTLNSAIAAGEFDRQIKEVIPKFKAQYVPVRRYLPRERWDELLDKLPTTVACVVSFMLGTGCRRSGAERAERGDVDLVAGNVFLRETKTARASRVIPITSISRPYVERALRDSNGHTRLFGSWSGYYVQTVDAALKSMGVEHLSPNDFRRSYSKAHKTSGVPTGMISKILGHTTERMVNATYAFEDALEIRDAVEMQITERSRVRDLYETRSISAEIGELEEKLDPAKVRKILQKAIVSTEQSGFSIRNLASILSEFVAISTPGVRDLYESTQNPANRRLVKP